MSAEQEKRLSMDPKKRKELDRVIREGIKDILDTPSPVRQLFPMTPVKADTPEDELKTRIERLEELVVSLAQIYAFEQRLAGDDARSEQILKMVETFQRGNSGARITVPDNEKDVKFYRVYKREKRPCGSGLLPSRVAKMLFNAGYESLHDLNGATLSQIFGISGFGPAAIRDFMQFIHHYLPPDCKTE